MVVNSRIIEYKVLLLHPIKLTTKTKDYVLDS